MIIKGFKCAHCGNDDFYTLDYKEANRTGLYCSYCGSWLKWASKEEKILIAKKVEGCAYKKGTWKEKSVISADKLVSLQSARCSVCGKYHTTPYMYYFDDFNYCPNCGADMREGVEK